MRWPPSSSGAAGRARPPRRESVPGPQHASPGSTTASTHTSWRRSGKAHAPGRPPRPSGSPPCPPRPTPPTPADGRTVRPAAGSAPRRGGGYPGSPRSLPRSRRLLAGGRVPGRRLPATSAARTDADRRFSRLRFEKCSRVWGHWTSSDSARSHPRANRSARGGWGRHVGGRGGAPAGREC